MTHYLQYTCNDSKNQAQTLQGLEEFAGRNTYTTATIAKMRSQLIGIVLDNPNFKLTSKQEQFFKSIKDSKTLSPELEGKADALP